jgi:hypothetical protein
VTPRRLRAGSDAAVGVGKMIARIGKPVVRIGPGSRLARIGPCRGYPLGKIS